MPKSDDDSPVFYDKSGTRWKTTKIVLFSIVCCLAAFLISAIPSLLAERRVVSFQNSSVSGAEHINPSGATTPDPGILATKLSSSNVPVIGKGSLVRLVEVSKTGESHVAVDPFSRKTVAKLSSADASYINGDPYAIMRYGDTTGRRIVLTFDDGPHPEYTPPVLDLLSKNSITASFFVTGDNIVKYPEIAQRLVREGHIIANHTFTHVNSDFTDPFLISQEINQTQRVIAAATEQSSSFFRIPYGGDTDQSLRNSLVGILAAQKLGYTVTSYNFDSSDWKFTDSQPRKLPKFDGNDIIVLLHDGGGNRSHTLTYVKELITQSKKHGYSFANLDDLYGQIPPLAGTTTPTLEDKLSFAAAWSVLVLPRTIITGLFLFSLVSILLVTTVNIILAAIHRHRVRYEPLSHLYKPFVSVIVPAYNEGSVLIKTVHSIISSSYSNIEIIVVDDGSTDNTWRIAKNLESEFDCVVALHQSNGGKASAMNNALTHSKGSIIISIDADTILPPSTISNLIRHFKDKRVGAVAGVVKVGNVKGMLTVWQALEYAISISIERNAHALLGSIMIVPGACGAWRKSAVIKAGGVSHSTLAEDCDLTLKIQQLGQYKILQDNEAVSYTEAPQDLTSLIKQRFRWTFGNIQSLFKHHKMIFNEHYRFLGMFTMPFAVVSILIPLFFWPILTFIAINNIMTGNYLVILVFFTATMTLQFIVAFIGLRMSGEPLSYIVAVPFARFIYGPIRVYILYKTVITALKGSYVGWNKLTRTGAVEYTPLQPHTISQEQAAP